MNSFLLPAAATALLAAGSARAGASTDIAARVGTEPITLAQVDARLRQAEPEAWQALFEARRRALYALVDARLLAIEAERRGIDRDSLVAREITAAVAAVTDSAVQGFYEQHRAGMDGKYLEEMRAPIRDYLAADHRRRAWQAFLSRLRERADVDVLLQPPRTAIEISPDEPSLGPVDAPVQLVEYSDFECPYCARVQAALKKVRDTYGDRVRLVYRDFPLAIHENAHRAAEAGACAHEQERFWEFHDRLFASPGQLGPADLVHHAAAAGLDSATFAACLESGRHAAAVEADLAAGREHGVSGTPAFFVNGRRLSGAQSFAAFQRVIDEELDRPGLAARGPGP